MNYATNRQLLERVEQDLRQATDRNQAIILGQVHYIHRIVDAMLTDNVASLPTT